MTYTPREKKSDFPSNCPICHHSYKKRNHSGDLIHRSFGWSASPKLVTSVWAIKDFSKVLCPVLYAILSHLIQHFYHSVVHKLGDHLVTKWRQWRLFIFSNLMAIYTGTTRSDIRPNKIWRSSCTICLYCTLSIISVNTDSSNLKGPRWSPLMYNCAAFAIMLMVHSVLIFTFIMS